VRLPGRDKIKVTEAKIAEYLLSPSHPYGRHKAAFLMRFGFSLAQKSELAAALRSHGAGCEVTKVETSPFGMRYTVEGKLVTPDGRNPVVRSVWFVEKSEDTPRLVTVYPIGGKRR
jgi:uncharacterized protein DUF6883